MKTLAGMVVVAALLAGCTDRRLDGTGPDGGVITSDGGTDTDPSDAPPITGVRSFVVTSVLQRDGGFGSAPSSHTFTLVLDTERQLAIFGASGEVTARSLDWTGVGDLTFIDPFQWELVSGCSSSSVAYNELVFTVGDDTLTGTGRGKLFLRSGDVADSADATMVLTGVRDVQPPSLSLSGGLFTDPFASFLVLASEPLPTNVTAVLRAADGETIALPAVASTGRYIRAFRKPETVLRYATQYQIITDGLADFAGHAGTGLEQLYFMTRPLPPLAAEDGFESLTDATFAGVEVLSGPPAISGTKSLYIPPTATLPPTQPELALRVPVAVGDTVLRFAYRAVKVSSTSFSYGSAWALGSVGGTGVAPVLSIIETPLTSATIGTSSVMLGPIMEASFTLPPDAATEVVLQRTFRAPENCGPPLPGGISGIIIDDLRVE